MLAALPTALLLAARAQAQIGSGWTQITPTERLEYETNDVLYTISPAPSSFNNGFCSYNKSGSTETFKLLSHYSNRIEIRPNDDYSSGTRQFQADIVISSPSTGESIHQIFNGPTGPWFIAKEFSNYNGSIKIYSGSVSGYVATNLYGHSFRLNTINDMNNNQCYVYINGQLVWQVTNPGGTFYTKYGTYGTHDDAHPATVAFSNVALFTGGNTNVGGIDTSAEYQLQNEASGLVLNNQGSLTNGSKITQWASGSSDNLKWKFISTDSGYYQINSVKSGLDAVVQSASTSQGAGIIQWSFGSAQNDQWLPQQNSDGSYTFVNRHSGLVLEDPGSSMDDHTQMDQWGSNGGSNQKWNLLKQ